MIATTKAGEIVVALTRTGKTERVLASRKVPIEGMALSPDLTTLLFVEVRPKNCPKVLRVSTAGGPIEEVATGSTPAVSPEGRHVAWAEMQGRCGSQAPSKLHVRDLQTGQIRVWTDDSEIGSFSGPLFFRDESTLYVLLCGADSCGPSLFDTKTMQPGEHVGAAELEGNDVSWTGVLARRSNLVTVPDYAAAPMDARRPLIEIDPRSGRIVEELMENPPGEPLDFDKTGTHLLIATDEGLTRWHEGQITLINADLKTGLWLE